jgi:hypothetical protein
MKEIKLIHIMIAVILVLLSAAIIQWVIFPKSDLPPATGLSEGGGQPEELPVLPQNELYNSGAPPSLGALPPFEETRGQDMLEPKDPALGSEKTGY